MSAWPFALTTTRSPKRRNSRRLNSARRPLTPRPRANGQEARWRWSLFRHRTGKVAYFTSEHLEAPNWSPKGDFFILQSRRAALQNAEQRSAGSDQHGTLTHLNNDHGISPDGTMLAISDQTLAGGSRIYVLPSAGGTPKLLTSNAPSYFHGWSPDGKDFGLLRQRTFTTNGQRTDNFDIYTVPSPAARTRG